MSTARRHIAIDLGASSGRVIEVRIGDGELAVRELHRFANGPVTARHAGSVTLCWSFERLWDGIVEGLRAAAATGDVDSIGIDTWGVDYALLDEDGEPVRPLAAYRDPRTQGPYARLRADPGDAAIYRATGIQFQPFNTLYQLAADAEDPIDPFERAHRMLLLPDFIASRLCGSSVAERTNASTTQLLDARTREWNLGLARAAGVPERILPPLVDAGAREPLGTLLPEVADETGLAPTTPVLAVATHDTASAVLAAPIDPARDLFVSSGTWSLVGAELAEAVADDAAREANMTNELGAFGSVRFLRNVSGLWLVQQLEESFEAAGRRRSWADLAALAAKSEPFRSVIDPNDPSLFAPGEMVEHIQSLCRARGEAVPASDAELVRCALDSVALATAAAAHDVRRIASHGAQRMVVVGGGSANAFLNQLIADCSGMPVVTGPAECTAIGNALMQHAALEGVPGAAPLRALVRAAFPANEFLPATAERDRIAAAAARVVG